ncbi:helix-turn-helix domain-containing protein [Paenibacillus agri]|uniref:AraC family transcriptional regulator n=1 Tax=Paenibacillus agri TaxID=2744309 RepID=A0A850EZA6_9BACL|nr:helix-turn-helix domain-containing protein [Paenibacillus agri]NUU63171.1 AraC family transcriptional regulator [Paenibacillus agri]
MIRLDYPAASPAQTITRLSDRKGTPMYNLAQHYHPITATPAMSNEIPPSKLLAPYIRCFWGSDDMSVSWTPAPSADSEIIIPDTCMDIIWDLDEDTGRSSTLFHGINDAPFAVPADRVTAGGSRFAIRFYFWGVHYFADDHLRDVLNAHVDVEAYFGTFRRELGELLTHTSTMPSRIAAAEAYLLRRLENRCRTNDNVMNAVNTILQSRGVVTAEELQRGSGLSQRQLERLFREYIGITPKKTADLVRFQNTWQELYHLTREKLNMQDLVYAYRFSDQSHFNNSFKKYAGRTPLEALAAAGR